MKLIELKCPGCGAQMLVDRVQKKAFCEYCSMVTAVDEKMFDDISVNPSTAVNPEEAGYLYEKQQMKAREEAEEQAELERRLRVAREERDKEELKKRIMMDETIKKAEEAIAEEQKYKESQKEQWIILGGFVGAVGLVVLFLCGICIFGGLLSNLL